jgi:hypothetical protein
VLIAVQTHIRLTRSFDQRSHSYQGYVLRVRSNVGGEDRDVLVAVGEAAHAKHQFRAGDHASGEGVPVADAAPRSPISTRSASSKCSAVERQRRVAVLRGLA